MSTSTKSSNHTASGPAAGYAFQFDRVLYRLSCATNDEMVGIEATDDVTTINEENEDVIREQAKHSTASNTNILTDRSKDLWKTLMIWIKAFKSNEFAIDNIRLVFVTNKSVPSGGLLASISDADEESQVDTVWEKLCKVAENPTKELREAIEYVLKEEDAIKALIPKIEVSAGNTVVASDNALASKLHLEDSNSSEILTQLKGWIHEVILIKWQAGELAIIKKSDFNSRLNNAKYDFSSKRIKERVRRLVYSEIMQEQRSEKEDAIFVKQLETIHQKDELSEVITEEIDNFLCADIERTRLILEGDVTRVDFEDFDEKCEQRWKNIKNKKRFEIKRIREGGGSHSEKLKEVGYAIYCDTADSGHCESLAGFKTTEPYLTKGTFHLLADALKLGWHPDWEEAFRKELGNVGS